MTKKTKKEGSEQKISAKKERPAKASTLIKQVKKRDGRLVAFDFSRITGAIHKAMMDAQEGSLQEAELVAYKVLADLVKIAKNHKDFVPQVEGIQDMVEYQLMMSEYLKTAKAFILFRQERAKLREKGIQVPEHVKKLAAESKKSFRNALGEFIYYRTYSRWIDAEGRRETWVETVDRYMAFMKENLGDKLKASEYKEVRDAIFKQEAMPSMRLLQFAGPAARKSNVTAYNCSFIAPSCFQDFAEIMVLSMSGAGVGFSAESKNIQQLPIIAEQTGERVKYVIEDSREGWADSLSFGMKAWYEGKDVDFDYSQLRPAGARLKTMGGKSSGPAPLMDIHQFTRAKILSRQGRRLSNLDAHDIICKIGEGVVSGGVRRTALISLSDLYDEAIRDSKKGQFYMSEPQRSLANNSAVYNTKPSNAEFMREWLSLMESGSGERGIFNRGGLKTTMPERRIALSTKQWDKFGVNPCGEIILRSKQFCNLTEVVARYEDTVESLKRKIRVATIIGTYQSSLTDFPYLSPEWKKNCEEERLLGVSVTGQWDCPAFRKPEVMKELKEEAIRVNKIFAKRFGINESASITCVKPSGNLSQTVDCSSGVHTRFAPYYIRRVRISATDSLFKMLKEQGIQYHPEVGQTMENATTYVIDFPVRAPKGSIFRDHQNAIQQLEYWKMVKENFTEHNPSTTVYIKEHEWIEVGNWVYQNWEIVGGLSFLPHSEHVYRLAPYEEITEDQFNQLSKRYAHIDFSKIVTYERADETEVKKELACAGGVCEIEAVPVESKKA